jgi:hypothetical protein
MSTDGSKNVAGFKIRYGADARSKAEEAARSLVMPPLLEADESLSPSDVALDVSFDDGSVQTNAPVDRFMD